MVEYTEQYDGFYDSSMLENLNKAVISILCKALYHSRVGRKVWDQRREVIPKSTYKIAWMDVKKPKV